MTTIHPESDWATRLEEKIDASLRDISHIKGQLDVVSPKDMAALQVKVGRQDVRIGYLSAGISAFFSTMIALLFKTGA